MLIRYSTFCSSMGASRHSFGDSLVRSPSSSRMSDRCLNSTRCSLLRSFATDCSSRRQHATCGGVSTSSTVYQPSPNQAETPRPFVVCMSDVRLAISVACFVCSSIPCATCDPNNRLLGWLMNYTNNEEGHFGARPDARAFGDQPSGRGSE